MRVSNSKYHWMSWIAEMLRRLRSGDVEGAANMIACCIDHRGQDHPKEESLWLEKMLRHPELAGRHWEIWTAMKPVISQQYRGLVRERLLQASWKIRPEDKIAA